MKNPSEWISTYNLRAEAKNELPGLTQHLVDVGNAANASGRASIYVFLDHAYGHQDWKADDLDLLLLEEVRRRDLRNDKIDAPWHIDVLYGAYFGSGDVTYLEPVQRILREGPSKHGPFYYMAEWSLNSLMHQYPHIAADVRQGGRVE